MSSLKMRESKLYAIVQTGNKQYRVSCEATIDVERLDKKVGSNLRLKEVLLASDGKEVRVGRPYLKDASVVCEVIAHPRGKKVIAFKYKKRKRYKKKIGHRQELTRLKVKEVKIGEK